MRCGGGLFFHRGGYGGRPIALRNHARVCVFKGAPRLGAGCERWKRLVFYGFFKRLVVMMENNVFLACARCFLSLVQAKRSFRFLKALILRRRPSNPLVHCRPCFVCAFCFLVLFVSLAFSLFFRSCCNSSRHRSPFALAFFSGAAAAAAGRGSPPPPRAGVVCGCVDTCLVLLVRCYSI